MPKHLYQNQDIKSEQEEDNQFPKQKSETMFNQAVETMTDPLKDQLPQNVKCIFSQEVILIKEVVCIQGSNNLELIPTISKPAVCQKELKIIELIKKYDCIPGKDWIESEACLKIEHDGQLLFLSPEMSEKYIHSLKEARDLHSETKSRKRSFESICSTSKKIKQIDEITQKNVGRLNLYLHSVSHLNTHGLHAVWRSVSDCTIKSMLDIQNYIHSVINKYNVAFLVNDDEHILMRISALIRFEYRIFDAIISLCLNNLEIDQSRFITSLIGRILASEQFRQLCMERMNQPAIMGISDISVDLSKEDFTYCALDIDQINNFQPTGCVFNLLRCIKVLDLTSFSESTKYLTSVLEKAPKPLLLCEVINNKNEIMHKYLRIMALNLISRFSTFDSAMISRANSPNWTSKNDKPIAHLNIRAHELLGELSYTICEGIRYIPFKSENMFVKKI